MVSECSALGVPINARLSNKKAEKKFKQPEVQEVTLVFLSVNTRKDRSLAMMGQSCKPSMCKAETGGS